MAKANIFRGCHPGESPQSVKANLQDVLGQVAMTEWGTWQRELVSYSAPSSYGICCENSESGECAAFDLNICFTLKCNGISECKVSGLHTLIHL